MTSWPINVLLVTFSLTNIFKFWNVKKKMLKLSSFFRTTILEDHIQTFGNKNVPHMHMFLVSFLLLGNTQSKILYKNVPLGHVLIDGMFSLLRTRFDLFPFASAKSPLASPQVMVNLRLRN